MTKYEYAPAQTRLAVHNLQALGWEIAFQQKHSGYWQGEARRGRLLSHITLPFETEEQSARAVVDWVMKH